mgnify:CR=1 FL=1
MQATINTVCNGIFINRRGNSLSDNRIAKNSIVQVISHIVSLQSLIIDFGAKAFGLADFVITFRRDIFDTGYEINLSIFQRKNFSVIIRDALNGKLSTSGASPSSWDCEQNSMSGRHCPLRTCMDRFHRWPFGKYL